ncbi:MAG: hypothetical protein ACFB5Z_18410 [Elainellaceae cyanobacterium]
MTATQLVTYEEYQQQPYDGRRTELVKGRVIELNDPTAAHADVVENFQEALKAHIKAIQEPYLVRSKVGVQRCCGLSRVSTG